MLINDLPRYEILDEAALAELERGWRRIVSELGIEFLHPEALEVFKSAGQEVEGELYVSGSGTLVRALLADGLVDELHLFVYPLTRGSGPRLFPDGAAPLSLSLAACESYENGVVYLSYRPAG